MWNFFRRKDPEMAQDVTQEVKVQLTQGLQTTSRTLWHGIKGLFSRKSAVDAELVEWLEERLLAADVGVTVTNAVIDELRTQLTGHSVTLAEVMAQIQKQLIAILQPCAQPLVIHPSAAPFTILFVGVNGSGKTTTIGKFAQQLLASGHRVLLAAGDTYRAAAIDQLKIWGERNQVPVIAQRPGADSAAVIYDAFQAAQARNIEVLIADTAGRLHTHQGLMAELSKIKRVLQRANPQAPQEVLLILDATIGQNALNQVRQFNEIIGITGLGITKLDGTAKGGAIFAIAQATQLPIRFIGVGEGIGDLLPFDATQFVQALFAAEQAD